MKKLELLREHLLKSALDISADDLHIFTDQGNVTSFQGAENSHFSLKYQANIILTDFSGDANATFLIILQWMKIHQPNHQTEDLKFEVDILKHDLVDLSFVLMLTEVVKVTNKVVDGVEGYSLTSSVDPDLYETFLPSGDWGLTITHNPSGPPEA